MKKLSVVILGICLWGFISQAYALIQAVAAENVYGSIISELGGPYVKVITILKSPDQDPHLFNVTPSAVMALANAKIIVYNGADYDPWMASLLPNASQRHILNVADLLDIKSGENPHIWYLPQTMPTLAAHLTKALIQSDSSHQSYYEAQLKNFNTNYQIILNKIAELKQKYQGTPVIATESLFNAMTESIGLKMHGKAYQLKMMNDVPPTISQIKDFENLLKNRAVKVLIYNQQMLSPSTLQFIAIAKEANIPTLGISEIMPLNMTYVEWVMQQLDRLDQALQGH